MSAPVSDLSSVPVVTLILGGARSGKSAYAEEQIITLNRPAIYLATAQMGDGEMAERIALHRARRGDRFRTVEEPLDLPGALQRLRTENKPILVDCLTLWLSNLMAAQKDTAQETKRLLAALAHPGADIILVSNEVGLGIVPDNALARAFRDHAGRLHQDIARIAGRVVFVAAGLPLALKGSL